MVIDGGPFYTYHFGSLGTTLGTARRTPFFEWFHLEETERRKESPAEAVRFRPAGAQFRDQCYLDILIASGGEMVRTELVLQRSFVDGADRLFAQDLVKSFLLAALPDACRHMLSPFMSEITTPGGPGETPGMRVFLGRQESWDTLTGWSRVMLRNVPDRESHVLVIHTQPNPTAPNAVGLKTSV